PSPCVGQGRARRPVASSRRRAASPPISRTRRTSKGEIMQSGPKSSRREFLKLATATTVAASSTVSFLDAQESTPVAPADRVGLATIGLGGQGTSDTKAALKTEGVELVAVADLYDGRLARAKETFGEKVATTLDYKEILARPDVDAVI